MSRVATLSQSTLGRKALVAVTGIVLFGFVVLHMAGNLKALAGAEPGGEPAIDVYARFLRTMGAPMLPHGLALWCVRLVLLVALAVHVVTSIRLALHNRAARPVGYRHGLVYVESTLGARTMVVSGVGLLVFAVIHILQFTTGTIQITPVEPEHVYANLYHGFQVWFVAVFYVVAMALLGFHLYHGAWSLFQTLGIDNPDRNPGLRLFAALAAVIVVLGFCAVPLLFVLNLMPAPPGGP